MQLAIIIGIVIFVLVLNVGATIGIHKDDGLNTFQRKAQIIFVWIIPVIGALFIYYFRDGDADSEYKDDGLSSYEVVDPELPALHDDSGADHGHDWNKIDFTI